VKKVLGLCTEGSIEVINTLAVSTANFKASVSNDPKPFSQYINFIMFQAFALQQVLAQLKF